MRYSMMSMLAAAAVAAAIPAAASAEAAATMNHGASNHSCPAATEAQVASLFDQFNAAWATGNPDTVTALFTANPVLLATVSNTPRTNPASVRDYFVSFLQNRPVGKIDTSTIEIDCRTASRLGTWTVTLTNPNTGAKTDVKARYSFIYRFENGAWKIDHLHSSAMPETAR